MSRWRELLSDCAPAPMHEGEWFVVRLNPDAILGEFFNIGVCLIDSDGVIHIKMLENFSIAEMLWKNAAERLGFMCRYVEDGLKEFGYSKPLSPNIKCSKPYTVVYKDVESCLNAFYTDMITPDLTRSLK